MRSLRGSITGRFPRVAGRFLGFCWVLVVSSVLLAASAWWPEGTEIQAREALEPLHSEGRGEASGVVLWGAVGLGVLSVLLWTGRTLLQRRILGEREQAHRREVELLESKNAEILRAQAQLVQAEKMASLGQLVAGVAHEINNPVNFIAAGLPSLKRDLELLLDKVPVASRDAAFVKAEQRVGQLIEIIEEGSRRTLEIVGNLRSFSRLDEAEVKTVDLHQALDATLSLLTHRTKDRIRIARDYGDLPPVECYVSQINQVFMNLLVNAIQAIEGKGTIILTTRRLSEDHGGEDRAVEDRVEIVVRDTGRGIAQELQGKIFDPFFTTKPVGQGTGLGLSISHGIVAKHRGSLGVESAPGEGAKFTVVLPTRLVRRGQEIRVLV